VKNAGMMGNIKGRKEERTKHRAIQRKKEGRNERKKPVSWLMLHTTVPPVWEPNLLFQQVTEKLVSVIGNECFVDLKEFQYFSTLSSYDE
jgi:hypothetical protein